MKIIINAVSAKSGGAVTFIQNLIQELSRLKFQHEFIFCIPTNQQKSLRDISKNIRIIGTDIGYSNIYKRLFWDQITLRKIINEEKIDVLISSSDFGMLFPPCKQILLLRNPLFFSSVYKTEFFPKKSLWFKFDFALRFMLVTLSAWSSDIILTASQSMLNDVKQYISLENKKNFVSHFGVSLEKFNPEKQNPERVLNNLIDISKETPTRILYVSEYGDYKNLTTLLKAFQILTEKNKKRFFLSTTADPKQYANLEFETRETDISLLTNPKISSDIEIIGFVPYNEITNVYRQSHIFVFPSLVESFGHPLVEAMACGLPIIASDIPIHREICNDAAIYFNPLNPDDLAEKILMLSDNKNMYKELRSKGLERVKMHFNWKNYVNNLINIIEELSKSDK